LIGSRSTLEGVGNTKPMLEDLLMAEAIKETISTMG